MRASTAPGQHCTRACNKQNHRLAIFLGHPSQMVLRSSQPAQYSVVSVRLGCPKLHTLTCSTIRGGALRVVGPNSITSRRGRLAVRWRPHLGVSVLLNTASNERGEYFGSVSKAEKCAQANIAGLSSPPSHSSVALANRESKGGRRFTCLELRPGGRCRPCCP